MAMIMGTISQTCRTEDTVNIGILLYVGLVHLLNYIWYNFTIFLSVCLHSGPEKLQTTCTIVAFL